MAPVTKVFDVTNMIAPARSSGWPILPSATSLAKRENSLVSGCAAVAPADSASLTLAGLRPVVIEFVVKLHHFNWIAIE